MSENQSVGYPASDKTSDPSTSRKLAEWITMILSAMIVLAVAGYLVYGITQPDEPFVASQVRVLKDQARRQGQAWIVPVEVHNRGSQTLRRLLVDITWPGDARPPESRRLQIDYLGERATHTSYLYLPTDPAGLTFDAHPISYQID